MIDLNRVNVDLNNMSDYDLVCFIFEFEGEKNPPFSTETVGNAVGGTYTDKRFNCSWDTVIQLPSEKLKNIVKYILLCQKAEEIEDKLAEL